MEHNWHGIMKIVELEHRDRHGALIQRMENIRNLLHTAGEGFILKTAFAGGILENTIPAYYYLGLDNRSNVTTANTITDVFGEPYSLTGYLRQPISSSGDFVVGLDNGHYIASSPVLAFRGSGGSWGPVSKLFLTDRNDNSGTLISTATLDTPITVTDGEYVTLRITLGLKEYSV